MCYSLRFKQKSILVTLIANGGDLLFVGILAEVSQWWWKVCNNGSSYVATVNKIESKF